MQLDLTRYAIIQFFRISIFRVVSQHRQSVFLSLSICLSMHISLSIYLSVSISLSLSLSVCLSVSLSHSVCLSVSFSLSLFICLSLSLSHSLSVYLSLSLYLSVSRYFVRYPQEGSGNDFTKFRVNPPYRCGDINYLNLNSATLW